MYDHHHPVNWQSLVQGLVSAHQLFEREGKIIVSKLLLEKSEIKTRLDTSLTQNLDFQDKIHSLETIVESLAEKNRCFQQHEVDRDVKINLENEAMVANFKKIEKENAILKENVKILESAVMEKDGKILELTINIEELKVIVYCLI